MKVIGYCQRMQTTLENGWLSFDICSTLVETKEKIYVFPLSRDVLGVLTAQENYCQSPAYPGPPGSFIICYTRAATGWK